MIRTAFILTMLATVMAGCGGPAAPTRAPGQATPAPGQATPAPGQATPVPPPPVGGGTVSVTVTGGQTPGSYIGSANPNCSYGFLGAGVWGVSYADDGGGSGVTGVVLVSQPAAPGANQGSFSVSVTIGTSALYSVLSDGVSANAVIQITDNGATAVIHASGGTIDGTGTVDVTINCPSIVRV